MELLKLTLPTAAENVALDEALLDAAETGNRTGELLRLWELARPAVVIGRSSRFRDEVDLEECRRQGIDVVRRSSGGAAIVAGPGCLMVSLVLSYKDRPALRYLDQAHRFVLSRLAESLGARLAVVPLGRGTTVMHCGTSDLAVVPLGRGTTGAKKFSGSSLRCKRDWFLYHGTLLYAFSIPQMGALLRMPPRQPDYRRGRSHEEFVANLPLARSALVQAAIDAFGATQTATDWPREEVQRAVRERYGREEWTHQR